jgi:hypothetical protein
VLATLSRWRPRVQIPSGPLPRLPLGPHRPPAAGLRAPRTNPGLQWGASPVPRLPVRPGCPGSSPRPCRGAPHPPATGPLRLPAPLRVAATPVPARCRLLRRCGLSRRCPCPGCRAVPGFTRPCPGRELPVRRGVRSAWGFLIVGGGRSTRGVGVMGVTGSRLGNGEHGRGWEGVDLICAMAPEHRASQALKSRSPQGPTDPAAPPPRGQKRAASDPAESDAVLFKLILRSNRDAEHVLPCGPPDGGS